MKRKLIFIFSISLLLVAGWLFGQRRSELANLRSLPDHSTINWQLEGKSLKVEVVNTPASITQGLGERTSLDTDGMLFVFSQPTQPIFWMKGMLFPIDIIWMKDGKVVGIEKNVQPPAPGTADSQLERLPAPQLVDMVLETQPGRLSQ